MPIQVTCNSCSSRLKAPDGAVGRKLKCPKCGAPITVVEVPAERRIQEVEQEKFVPEQDPFAGIGENQKGEGGVPYRSTRNQGSPVLLLVALVAVVVILPVGAGLFWWLNQRAEIVSEKLAKEVGEKLASEMATAPPRKHQFSNTDPWETLAWLDQVVKDHKEKALLQSVWVTFRRFMPPGACK